MAAPTKDARVLKFFTQRLRGALGVTQLQKLAYFADLHARRYLGRPITSFAYTFYRHGPFDRRLYATVREMERRQWVRSERRPLLGGREKQAVTDAGTVPDLGFSPAETRILDYVADTYGALPLDELLALVYETEPMLAAKRDGPVPMEIVDGQARRELGYDLEEVLEQEREIERGHYLLHDDFFDALRAEVVAGDAA
jgi:uncharacterized phage-associated protein